MKLGDRDRVSLALVGDVLLAALFTLTAQLDVWVRHTVTGPQLTNAAILAFVAPPLAFRRTRPSAAVAVTAAAIAVQAVVVGEPPSGFLYAGPVLIGSYSLGVHAPACRRALAALAALVIGYGVTAIYWTGGQGLVVTDVLWSLAPVAPWFVGRFVRRRRLEAAAEAQREGAERERERHRLAALEDERSRMARELHDILAHSVSVMGVQAGAAEEMLARDPERARPLLQSIQQTSRDSVAELRRLLGMLRAQELGPELAPQPGLDQLDTLVARMHDSGLPVELRIEGTAHPLPPGVELTAYRVVQESLTNALKHARPSTVEVAIDYRPSRLVVRVTNDGVVRPRNGDGHGLIGMNERVSLYGGRLDAATRADGTFRVHAEIPVEPVGA
jgi:signal transduction histidine kinase